MHKSDENVIQVKGLHKKFGNFSALDGFDIEVKKGEVHGFLGPNGSGKSTTIRVLLGLLRKSSGEALLFGEDPWVNAVKLHQRLAYVPGDVNFWPNLSGGEIIDLIGKLRGGLDEKRRSHLLAVFDLDPKKKFHTYSKGNRQKVALIAALASDVELYILDEPTSGLDPLMEAVFQKEIRSLKLQQKTILLSSHILAEVESLCDKVTLIRNGKTVESGSLSQIRSKHRTIMTIESPDDLSKLSTLQGVHEFEKNGADYSIEVDQQALARVLNILNDHEIISLTSQPPSLEHLFISHYEEEK